MDDIIQKIEMSQRAVQEARVGINFTYVVLGKTIELTFTYSDSSKQKKIKYYSNAVTANAVENVLHYDIMSCFNLYSLYKRQNFIKRYFKEYAYASYIEKNNLSFEVDIDNLLV